MVVLGAVLLVLAVLVALGLLFTNGSPANLSFFGVSLSHVSVSAVFLAGLVTGAVALLALSLLLGGGARKRHKRVEAKKERRALAGSAGDLAEENTRLRAELGQSRAAGGGSAPGGDSAGEPGTGRSGTGGLTEGGLTQGGPGPGR